MEEAFQGAQPEVAAVVQATVTSVKEDAPASLEKLQDLGRRPDLTPAQRAVAHQAMYAVLARLNSDATNGNTKAAEALEQYRSSK